MRKKARSMLIIGVLVALFLLTSGYSLIGLAAAKQPTPSMPVDDTITFQEYLWYQNPVVLTIQIGLMLAGALGVAALLPSPDEESGSN